VAIVSGVSHSHGNQQARVVMPACRQLGIGMDAAIRVPPFGGSRSPTCPEGGDAIGEPQKPAARRACAARAIVAYLDAQDAAIDAYRDRGTPRPGVFGDVRQCLRDHEVRGGLDRRRKPADGDSDVDGQRGPLRQRLHGGAHPTPRQDCGHDPLRELAYLAGCVLGLFERLADQLADRVEVARVRRALRQLERHDRVDEPLLCAVVQIAHDAPALAVRRRDEAREGGGELLARLQVRHGKAHELGELGQPALDAASPSMRCGRPVCRTRAERPVVSARRVPVGVMSTYGPLIATTSSSSPS
jgi:hypothetical protein